MDRILSQFRRIYGDDGRGDKDFSIQEEKLRLSQDRLTKATQDLVRASENLNNAAMGVEGKTKH